MMLSMEMTKPSDFKFTFASEFFFDTNIWLLLYGKIADYQKNDQKEYSRLFGEIISRKSAIYINSMIISELANVILKFEFGIWQNANKVINSNYKKDFVGTEQYQKTVAYITTIINKILQLPNIIRIPDDFNSLNMGEILENFKQVDFNDAYIYSITKSKNLILVTNDGDYKKINTKIKVISTQ